MRRAALSVVVVVVAAMVAWWMAADPIRRAWSDLVAPLSPHARYARALEDAGLHETALGRAWTSSAAAALRQPSHVTLPFETTVVFDEARPSALAWRFAGRRGRRIEVAVEQDARDARRAARAEWHMHRGMAYAP